MGDGAGGSDTGDLAKEVGKVCANMEETCEEGESALRLNAGVDAGLLSASAIVIPKLFRNMRSVSV